MYGAPLPELAIRQLKGDASTRSYFRVLVAADPRIGTRRSAHRNAAPRGTHSRSDEGGSPAEDRQQLPFLEVGELLRSAADSQSRKSMSSTSSVDRSCLKISATRLSNGGCSKRHSAGALAQIAYAKTRSTCWPTIHTRHGSPSQRAFDRRHGAASIVRCLRMGARSLPPVGIGGAVRETWSPKWMHAALSLRTSPPSSTAIEAMPYGASCTETINRET